MIKIPVLKIHEEFKDYDTGPRINAPQAVYDLLKPLMPALQEAFYLLSLNTKNGVLAIRLITQGSLNANIVHPRETFRAAYVRRGSTYYRMSQPPKRRPYTEQRRYRNY
jgi:DNA repair protein RadC